MTRFTCEIIVSTVAIVAIFWVSSPALIAQSAGSGEFRRELAASVSTFGGYDTDVTGRLLSDPRLDKDGSLLGTAISLKYRTRFRQIDFSTQGDSDLRRYYAAQTFTDAAFSGSAAIGAEVTRKLHISGMVHSGYLPQFQFSLMPASSNALSLGVAPTLDHGVSRDAIVSVRSDAGLIYSINNRSEFRFTYGTGHYSLIDRDYQMKTHMVRGVLSRDLTRYATLRIGYGEQHVAFPSLFGAPAHALRNRLLDAGVDYSRPLSASRRTTVGFGTGTAAVKRGPDQFFTMTGHGSVTHMVSRSWKLAGLYTRGLAIVEGFEEAFFADAVSLNLEGLLREKLNVVAMARYSKGNVALGPHSNDYSGMAWSARAELPIWRRRVSLFGNYFYYGYSFNETVRVPVGLARTIGRHGVRAGLTFIVPLLTERTAGAPR